MYILHQAVQVQVGEEDDDDNDNEDDEDVVEAVEDDESEHGDVSLKHFCSLDIVLTQPFSFSEQRGMMEDDGDVEMPQVR